MTQQSDITNIYTLAEAWTALGFRCFPLRGKVPAVPSWPRDASSDPDVVRDWVVQAGNADGLGVIPGPTHIVADCDVKNGDGRALADSLGLNHTWKQPTPSGGEHRWFTRPPGGIVGNAVPEDWNGLIDIRADAGYVRVYGPPWADAGLLRQFPLLDRLRGSVGTSSGTWRRYDPAKHDAQLHPATVAAHRVLVEKHGVRAERTEFHAEKGREPYLIVTRPGRPREAAGGSGSLGYLGAATLHSFSSSWHDFPPGNHDIAVPDEVAPWGLNAVTAKHLDTLRFEPLRYLVPGILTLGGVALLAGPPKSGKSMLALALAHAVATGGVALGGKPVSHAGGVMFVSLDDRSPARLQRRLRMVAAGGELTDTLHLHTVDDLGRGTAAVDRLIGYLDRTPGTALVVIDTIEHVRPDGRGGESAYSADVRFLGALRRIVDKHPDVSLLCLTHTRKGVGGVVDDAIEGVSGTHGVTGGADHVLRLKGARGVPKRVLDVVGRDADDVSFVVGFDDARGWVLTGEDPDDPTVHLSADDGALYRAVTAFGAQGATAADLAPECEHVSHIPQRLVRLERRGYLRRTNRGRYTAR